MIISQNESTSIICMALQCEDVDFIMLNAFQVKHIPGELAKSLICNRLKGAENVNALQLAA